MGKKKTDDETQTDGAAATVDVSRIDVPRLIYKGHTKGAEFRQVNTLEELSAALAEGWVIDVPDTWYRPEA